MAEHRVVNEDGQWDPTNTQFDGLRLMVRDLAAAETRHGPATERWFAVGDDLVRLRFVGDRHADALTRALGHLAIDDPPKGADPALTIDVWDSATTGVGLSPLLRLIVDATGIGTLSSRHELPSLTGDNVRTTVLPWDGLLSMYDVDARRAYIWVEDPSELPIWDFGAPFRTVFNWWLSDTGRYCIHASAVGTSAGAVLLTGKGGSGKSTASLACVGTELQYLSDDYCVLSMSEEPEVLSLYNTAKLNGADDLARQPRFEPWVVNSERRGEEKQLMFLHDHVPEALIDRAPLRAVVLPTVTDREVPVFERISGGAALRALAPTSLFQLPGTGGDAMAKMARLVRTVPCYRMESGRRLETIAPSIRALLDPLDRGEHPPERVGPIV